MLTRRLDLMVMTDEELAAVKSRLNTVQVLVRESGANEDMLGTWAEYVGEINYELLCRADEFETRSSAAARTMAQTGVNGQPG